MQKQLLTIGLLVTMSMFTLFGCLSDAPATRAAVKECDELAAPQDPSRTVKEGVEDGHIAAGAAIPACQSVVDAMLTAWASRSVADRLFVDAILSDCQLAPTFDDGVNVQEVIDAALASSLRDSWVKVK